MQTAPMAPTQPLSAAGMASPREQGADVDTDMPADAGLDIDETVMYQTFTR